MTDLARKAMEKIAEIVGGRFEDADVEVLRAGINSVGALISHEQAALLREVERLDSWLMSGKRTVYIGNEKGRSEEFHCIWFEDGRPVLSDTFATNLTAALKSALDAAGVPDAARMGERA